MLYLAIWDSGKERLTRICAENEHYSVSYFDHVSAFELNVISSVKGGAQMSSESAAIKGGTQMHCVNAATINAFSQRI